MRKNLLFILIAMLLIVCLAGCSFFKEGQNEKAREQNVSQDTSNSNGEKETSSHAKNENLARYMAYAKILDDFYEDKKMTYGIEMGEIGAVPNFAENKYAIFDIDGDGEEELLIVYTTSTMAGMAEYIYGYDAKTEEAYEKLSEFPALTIYDNGVITAAFSHNQGLAGDALWPFRLYQYRSETRKYEEVATVDAWDRSYRETDFDGTPFPEELDQDDDGILYYVEEKNEERKVMNQDAYREWLVGFLRDAKELEIPFVDYTKEQLKKVETGESL